MGYNVNRIDLSLADVIASGPPCYDNAAGPDYDYDYDYDWDYGAADDYDLHEDVDTEEAHDFDFWGGLAPPKDDEPALPKLYIRSSDPGHVRVSIHPNHPGIRLSMTALILGVARRAQSR